jgi:tetratricopeptide (TPR) repeat protein
VTKGIKKELRQPDEFVSFWTHAAEQAGKFATERKRALVAGATMLATVIAGSLIFSTVKESRALKATAGLVHAERIANGALRPEGTPATNPDGTPLVDDGIPHFKTEKERDEAALKELDTFLAGSPADLGNEARLQRGPLLLALGRADEAISAYQQLLNDKLEPRLRFLATEGLGYAQEAKGDLNAAAATFAKLGEDAASGKEGAASKDAGFYKDRAVYHQARIAELRGNAGDAKKLYREVLDKNPTTSLRSDITNRLAVLELK